MTFTTTLGHFRNGSYTYTVQTQPPLGANGLPNPAATPTGVVETALIAGTKSGSAKVTVRSNNATQTIYISITGAGAAISIIAITQLDPGRRRKFNRYYRHRCQQHGEPGHAGDRGAFHDRAWNLSQWRQKLHCTHSGCTGIVSVSLLAGVVPGTNYVLAKTNEVTQAATIVFTNTYLSTLTVTANPSTIPADGVSTSICTATVMNVSNDIARQTPEAVCP